MYGKEVVLQVAKCVFCVCDVLLKEAIMMSVFWLKTSISSCYFATHFLHGGTGVCVL